MKTLVPWILVLFSYTYCFAEAIKKSPQLPGSYLNVPILRQATEYSCGPAVLSSILHYWKVFDGNEKMLYSALKTTKKEGTDPARIESVAKKYGLEAKLKTDLEISDLKQALENGETAVLSLQAWRDKDDVKFHSWKDTWEEGHYVVLVGIDSQYIYVMDPSVLVGYVYLPQDEFLDRWHDYENRSGTIWKYFHLGVFIKGKIPLENFPSSLVRME